MVLRAGFSRLPGAPQNSSLYVDDGTRPKIVFCAEKPVEKIKEIRTAIVAVVFSGILRPRPFRGIVLKYMIQRRALDTDPVCDGFKKKSSQSPRYPLVSVLFSQDHETLIFGS
jgi:hypothetical protein